MKQQKSRFIMKDFSGTTKLVYAATLVAVVALTPAVAQTAAEDLRLTVGKSIVIDYPSDVRQISTSDPAIVDASPVTTREILLHAKGLGSATMIIWSKDGRRTFYNIAVDANVEPLRRLLKETFPNEEINVQASRDSLSLIGRASSPAVAERATAMAAPFGKTVVNALQTGAAVIDKQVVLRVKFAELDRSRALLYGVNLISTGAGNTVGGTTTGQFAPPRATDLAGTIGGSVQGTTSKFTISDALNIFAFRPDLNLSAFIKALQSESILQILAEPNLVTTNGKEASFIVGGEFPVPVLQGGGNAGAITIMFREFGIRLLFTPVITENKTIKMHLRQEVSTIDLANAVTLNGFTIPALATRRAETDVELGQGQSFVVAGLVDNRESESWSKIPGLGSLPILGALFKSKESKQSRTELVMIVSPEITTPQKSLNSPAVPYFPKDFLVPITPPATGKAESSSKPAGTAPAKLASAGPPAPAPTSGRRWLGFRKN
jgi:pilus assembly protein CpaC